MSTLSLKRARDPVTGRPRYVVHFLNCLTPEEAIDVAVNQGYATACERARKWRGWRFHNKQYGGGIVFATTDPMDVLKAVNVMSGRGFTTIEVR